MEWTTSYQPDHQIVIIQTQGIADEASSLEMAKSISKSMQEYKVTRCLIDHSAISSVTGDVIRVYNRPKILRGIGVPRHIKIAEIVLLDHRVHFGFFETVCRNNGFDFLMFNDRESAIEWLTK
jgi:hypothetical protein